MEKITDNHIVASEGMTLIRTMNGEVMGKELWLGITYWVGGERVEPFADSVDNFSEITDEEARYQQYTYKATSGIEAVMALADGDVWFSETFSDDEKRAIIERYGGISEKDYESLVTALIRKRYSSDTMEAIINNYLFDDSNGEHRMEWESMQRWRAKSKEIAKELLRLLQDT